METNFNSHSSIPHSIFSKDEIALRIFSFVPIRSLFNCMRVCKEWERLASDASLWPKVTDKKYMHFEMPHIENARAVFLIVQKFQTGLCGLPNEREILSQSLPETERQEFIKFLEKKHVNPFPEIAFDEAIFKNYKKGFISLEEIKKLASLMKEKFNDSSGFKLIALDLIECHNIQGACEILDQNVLNHFDKYVVIESFITYFGSDKKLEEALQFGQKYLSTAKGFHLNSIRLLISLANKMDNESAIDTIMEELLLPSERQKVMSELIESCKKNNPERAQALQDKYWAILKAPNLRSRSIERWWS